MLVAAMLAIVTIYTLPVTAQTDETTVMAQAEDKAKNKDIVKEKGKEKGKKGKDKKGKDKAKSKDKKDKDKGEETDLPTSGGVSGSYAAVFTLGAGALLFGGVLLARGLLRRTGRPPGEDREGESSKDGD